MWGHLVIPQMYHSYQRCGRDSAWPGEAAVSEADRDAAFLGLD